MIRPILRYGEPLLHRRADRVPAVDADIAALVDDLIATMRAASGVGLAAPQVGVSRRVFVIDVSMGRRSDGVLVLVNPEFERRAGMQLEEEGCLSVPGFQATVARPASVRVRGLGRDGEPVTIEGEGLLARALQHEMDHLDGVLFIDRLRPVRRRHILRRVEALRRRGRW
jgi:peptide deformylase